MPEIPRLNAVIRALAVMVDAPTLAVLAGSEGRGHGCARR